MSEQVKKLVPKFRFPELQSSSDWSSLSLGDIATFYKGKGLPKSAISSNGKTPCIHYGELFTHYSEVIDNVNSKTNTEGDYFLSKENDVLMPTSDVTPTGLAKASCITKNDVVLGGDILVIRTNKSQVDGKFLSRLIRRLEREVLQLVSGSTVFHLYASSLEKLKITLPSFEEQQKVADCLSSLDDLITAQNQKVDALKQHKKGLMQRLFPAEGETVPKLRFPEFENDGEWQESTIGQVAIYENGKAHEQDISELGRYTVVNSKFISTEGEVKKYTNEGNCLAKKNDILMVLSDVPNGRAIAKCFVVDENYKYTVNQRICKLTPTEVNSKFLFYLVNRNEYFLSFDDGVKQTNLKNDDVLNCPLLVPDNPKEQDKIANCISLLDEDIDIQLKKIELLIAHKKGLMQNLFPTESDLETF